MIFPIHYIRISFLRFLRMQIGKYTAICRGVDIRTPYRISIGAYTTKVVFTTDYYSIFYR